MLDGQLDEGLSEGLKLEPVIDGCLKRGGILRANTLAEIGTVYPDLVFEIRTGLRTRRV